MLASSSSCGSPVIKTSFTCSNRSDRTPIKSGLTPQSPFQGFCIGHRVLLQPTRGGALCILDEAFTVRLRGRCRHGPNQITSLITSVNFSVPAFTVDLTTTAPPHRISFCPPLGK